MLPQTKSGIEIPLGTHYGISGFLIPRVGGKPLFSGFSVRTPTTNAAVDWIEIFLRPKINKANKLFYVTTTAYIIGQSGQVLRTIDFNNFDTDSFNSGKNPSLMYSESDGTSSSFRSPTKNRFYTRNIYNYALSESCVNDPNVKDVVISIRPVEFDRKDANFSIVGGTMQLALDPLRTVNTEIWSLSNFFIETDERDRTVDVNTSSLNISDDINWDLPAYFAKSQLANSGIKYKFTLTPKPSGDPLIFYGDGHNPPRGTGWKLKNGTPISGDKYSGVRHTTRANTLNAGEYEAKFEVVGIMENGMFVLPTHPMVKTFTLVDTRPNVHGLEPNGIDVNIDSPVTVSWTADTQTSFEIKINGHHTIRGGTEKSIVVPVGTFRKGTNTIELTARNDTAQHSYSTVSASFRGYGKPSAPVFDSQTIYNTARPTFTWTCDEQVSYAITILKGSQIVKTTGDVTSNEKSYTVDNNLQNNTEYTIKLKVKNDKGLWSDEATKKIIISFGVTLKQATLNLFENDKGVVTINVSNPQNSSFDYCEIYRKATYEKEWRRIAAKVPLEIALNDNLIAANTEYQYKVISYDKQGGSIESAVKTARIKLKSMQFVDLDSMEDVGAGYSDSPDMPFKVRRIQDKAVIKYEGMKAPVTEQGETDYQAITFEFIFKNYQAFKAFQKKSEQSKVIAFRSTQGHFVYGQIVSWGEEFISVVGFTAVTFEFVEVNFIESEIYSGGKTLRVIRLDAGYKLDSGYVIDGVYYEN